MTGPWTLDARADAAAITQALSKYGVAVVQNALSAGEHAVLYDELHPEFEATQFSRGLFYGNRTKRFGRVLARSAEAQSLALNSRAIEPAKAILGRNCQNLQLNLTQAIEIWPGSYAQVPHRDRDIWLGAPSGAELMLNAMWALDDFTAANGATVVWPGSHRTSEAFPSEPGVPMEMPQGSVCLFLGSTLHSGGPNWSGNPRRGLVMSYCLGWLKPCENPWLSYPPQVAKDFAPELAKLIGYRQDAPSLNHVEGMCPSELLKPRPGLQAYSDQLTDEQIALIEEYNRHQLAHAEAA